MKTMFLVLVLGIVTLFELKSFSQNNNSIGTQPTNVPQIPGSADYNITNMTTGSVLFSGAGGKVSQSNAQIFWDNTNNRLGLGTASPGSTLDIRGQFLPLIRTKAQIDALVPAAAGALIICSDCTITYSVCTATGVAAAQWARAGSATVGCGTNN